MQSKAEAKWIRMSPRKVRRVVNEIRGKSVEQADLILRFMPFAAAREVWKVLNSARYNLVNHARTPVAKQEVDDYKVVVAFADQGPTLKRIQPHARGRAFPIKKRTSHITVVISDV